METPTAQIRIKKNAIIQEGSGGAIVWVTPARARLLIDSGAAELFGRIQPIIGPTETKPAEPTQKKYLAAEAGIPSTDSQVLTESATEKPSSVLVADPVLPKRKFYKSNKQVAK